jgi:hypothetical protein
MYLTEAYKELELGHKAQRKAWNKSVWLILEQNVLFVTTGPKFRSRWINDDLDLAANDWRVSGSL